ncbi:GntR family transcriptional regulator [Rugosimonospora africana]|uniref:HTH-type transcriptional regulator FrlR n=1 Tax=Rugosimonospora africana TaxID=556532 RepID=A0A8J3VR87_9ACTN|nr:GntR family transcriptional regulator [Rugosimonospora africana]GIH15925.1 HTH-type transcriptional regulator FrlR [Rugosimonospora africana]
MTVRTGPPPAPLASEYPEPLWRQAVDAIMRDVADGVLRPGMRLPPERELCQRLRISRVTLRKALGRLVDDGVVTSSHGRGWYIAGTGQRRGDWPNSLESFTETAQRMGLTATSEVTRQETVPASLDEAEKLSIAPGTPVFQLRRVRLLDGVPTAVDSSTVPTVFAPGFDRIDFTTGSLYRQLTDAGVDISRAECTIEAMPAGRELADRLGLAVGEPVLVMQQTVLDASDRPVFTSAITYHGGRYRLRTFFAR